MAIQISKENEGPKTINQKWVSRFFTRHLEIHTKKAVRLDKARANEANSANLKIFLTRFHVIRTQNNMKLENV